ncbi:hypothetical protein FQN57_006331 [Myotisia sp. PD_48]|nr:hypothetical protein FQN57_006331 [Myotisia sp. PD_48]
MNTEILTPLSSLETKLNALLTSITSTPTAAGATAATISLLETDDALTNALQTLRIHQGNYAKILRLRAEASNLEERVREIVRQVGDLSDEISASAYADGSEDDEDQDELLDIGDGVQGRDVAMAGTDSELAGDRYIAAQSQHHNNEVDYKLLLGFARRISKYNSEAAADATRTRAPGPVNGENKEEPNSTPTRGEVNGKPKGDPRTRAPEASGDRESTGLAVASLTQDTVSWLDETASWSRFVSSLPYPGDDRIRMGLVSQIQAAVGAEGKELDKLVEQALEATEGKDIPPESTLDGTHVQAETAKTDFEARVTDRQSGLMDTSHQDRKVGATTFTPAPPKPKPKLDLDLYDPDDDDL